MENKQMYFFVVQINAPFGPYFTTSVYPYETYEAFRKQIGAEFHKYAVAYTKIKEQDYEAAKNISKTNT